LSNFFIQILKKSKVNIIREFGSIFGLIGKPLVVLGFYEGKLENFKPRM
jgi:hypothetical protein